MFEWSLLLCVAFVAGLVDAIAGGGGLIQVPALMSMFPGAPIPAILGTNKLSSIAGTTASLIRYSKSVNLQWKTLIPASVVAFVFALLGARTAVNMDPEALRASVLMLLVVVTVHSMFAKGFGQRDLKAAPRPRILNMCVLAAAMGFYDGFFGPGAGSLAMFAMVRWLKFDFLHATSRTKILNLATNLGALGLFASTGNVFYGIGLGMAFCNLLGGLVGSHFAVKKGNQAVRRVFNVVLLLLVAKVGSDLLS